MIFSNKRLQRSTIACPRNGFILYALGVFLISLIISLQAIVPLFNSYTVFYYCLSIPLVFLLLLYTTILSRSAKNAKKTA